MSEFDIKDFSASEKNLKGELLKSLKKIEDFQKYFDELAKYIFGHVGIVIGDSSSKQIKYYLEEIEFYYNNSIIEEEEITYTSKDKKEKKEKKEKKNYFSCTYKRKRDAEQLFWHYSGVDICFQSDDKCYGGILIRSLTKEYTNQDGKLVRELIAGPLRCANDIINQCIENKINTIPRVDKVERYDDEYLKKLRSTIRQGIETSEKYSDIISNIEKDSKRYVKSKDFPFPFFNYYIERGDDWKTIVDDKKIPYSANPEKREVIRMV